MYTVLEKRQHFLPCGVKQSCILSEGYYLQIYTNMTS